MSDHHGARVQEPDDPRQLMVQERIDTLRRVAAEYVPPRWLLERMAGPARPRDGDPAKSGLKQ